MRNQQSYDAFKASPKWVFSPWNRVQRIHASKQQDMHRTDVSKTFRRIYKELHNDKR